MDCIVLLVLTCGPGGCDCGPHSAAGVGTELVSGSVSLVVISFSVWADFLVKTRLILRLKDTPALDSLAADDAGMVQLFYPHC